MKKIIETTEELNSILDSIQTTSESKIFKWLDDNEYSIGSNLSLSEFYYMIQKNISKQNIMRNSFESVDLDLPSGLLWSDRNIGAATEENAGLFFQWGDVQGYTAEQVGVDKQFNNDWRDYKWHPISHLTKYTDDDDLVILQPKDDAATANMGSDWRMPTRVDFIELIENTDIYGVSIFSDEKIPAIKDKNYNSFTFPPKTIIKGVKFYNKIDRSKYIFVPITGYAVNNIVNCVGFVSSLWTSVLDEKDDFASINFEIYACNSSCKLQNYNRYYGFNIRGVKSKYSILKEE